MKKIFLTLLMTMFLVGIANALEPNEIAIKFAKKATTGTFFSTEATGIDIAIKRSMMWSMIEQNKLLIERNKLLKELIITLKKEK